MESVARIVEGQGDVASILANTDDLDHIVRRRRIYRYLRYRHKKLGRLRHPLNRMRTIRPVELEEP